MRERRERRETLVSREAVDLIAKHSWNNIWDGRDHLYAYGMLIGEHDNYLFFSLPVSFVANWKDFDEDDFYKDAIVPAEKLAASFNMKVIGTYASSSWNGDAPDNYPTILTQSNLFIHYQVICCRGCSGSAYYRNGQLSNDKTILTPGKRITNMLTQKRVLAKWHKMIDREKYPYITSRKDV